MLMDVYAVVGDDDGLVNWDILCLFMFPLFAAEKEDGSLALLFLFHSGVQMALSLDGDGDAGVISAGGGVLWLDSWDVSGVVQPTAPSLGHGVRPLLHHEHGGGHLHRVPKPIVAL